MDVKYEALKLLKQLFTKQNFADAKLADGTIVSADAFEPGNDLFILDEAGERVAAPDGEHTLEDGTKVVVKEGKIETIVKSEESGEMPKEEEMAVEVEVEPYIEELPEKEEEIATLKKMVDDMMKKVSMVDEIMEKVKMMEEKMGGYKMSSDETSKIIADAVVELSENFKKMPGAEKLDIVPGEYQTKFEKISKVAKKQSIHDWLANNKKS